MKKVIEFPTSNGLTIYAKCYAIRNSAGIVVEFDEPREFIARAVAKDSDTSFLCEIAMDLPEINDVPH